MPQRSKKPTGFQQIYPNIAEWVNSYGWIETGDDGQSGYGQELAILLKQYELGVKTEMVEKVLVDVEWFQSI